MRLDFGGLRLCHGVDLVLIQFSAHFTPWRPENVLLEWSRAHHESPWRRPGSLLKTFRCMFAPIRYSIWISLRWVRDCHWIDCGARPNSHPPMLWPFLVAYWWRFSFSPQHYDHHQEWHPSGLWFKIERRSRGACFLRLVGHIFRANRFNLFRFKSSILW